MLLGQGGTYGQSAIYDVTDPVHPHLLCRILDTTASLSSAINFEYLSPRSAIETDLVIRWYADDDETPAGRVFGWITSGAWLPGGSLGAFTVPVDSSDQYPAGGQQVWTYERGTSKLLFTYRNGIGGCICRFGFSSPVLAISPDGRYLVAGRMSGKGSEPLAVYRLADRTLVATLAQDMYGAFWDRSTDRLFEVGFNNVVRVWTPDGSTLDLPGAAQWSFHPNLSPDGAYVVYTAYADAAQTQPRIYLYRLDSGKTSKLIDQPRSQVVFVKDDWVWYFEEQACSDCPNGTKSSGKVFAMNISTGIEQRVTFAMDETVTTELLPGEFWPNA